MGGWSPAGPSGFWPLRVHPGLAPTLRGKRIWRLAQAATHRFILLVAQLTARMPPPRISSADPAFSATRS